MVHKNFGIKPQCCGEDMFIEQNDDDLWFECNVGCEAVQEIPDGYFDNTPEGIVDEIIDKFGVFGGGSFADDKKLNVKKGSDDVSK